MRRINVAAKAMDIIVSMLTALGTMITAFQSAGMRKSLIRITSGSSSEIREIERFDTTQLNTIINSMLFFMDSFFGSGGNVIGQLVDVIAGANLRSIPRNIGQKVEAITNVMSMITMLTGEDFRKGIRGLMSFRGGVKGGQRVGEALIGSLTHLIRTMVNGVGNMFGDAAFLKNLNSITGRRSTRIKNVATAISSSFEALETLNTLATAGIDFNAIQTSLGKIDDNFSQKLQTGVTALITSINDAGTALRGLGRSPMRLTAELQRVNNALNLRGSDRITIRQQAVNLQIDLTVLVDTEEFAEALIENDAARIVIQRAE